MILLSPMSGMGRLSATRSLNYLKNPAFGISFMVIVGTRDAQDRNQARDTFRVVSGVRGGLPNNALGGRKWLLKSLNMIGHYVVFRG